MRLSFQLRALIIFFCGLILATTAGLRGGNDPDYLNYYDIYVSSRYGDLSTANVEPFYFYFNKVFSSAGIPFVFIMLLMAIPAVLLKMYVVCKHSHSALLSIILYSLTIYISFDLIAIRQGLAIAFVMLATSLWFHKKLLAVTLVLVASLFHFSALIVLPVFYGMSSRWHKEIINISLLIVFFVSIFGVNINIFEMVKQIPFIPSFIIYKLEIYASYHQEGTNSLKQFLVCIVAFWLYRVESKNAFIKTVCFLYVIGFLISILLSSIGDISFRVKWYFFWGEIFFIPYVLITIIRRIKNRNAIPLMVALFLLAMTIMYLYPAINFINDVSSRGNSLIL
ncbi:EpsG family protein [Aeromonas caviae]|uniref:EpsG family protein n=1 Tax=Aeromonas caviae TaxID=648 RepID=UPI0023DAFC5C|nr:EpsG family protein [Aeromonas caviae]MDF2275136.1 EpsG family protein [Aeromonas caviae]